MIKICPVCKSQFSTSHQKSTYCNRECWFLQMKGKHPTEETRRKLSRVRKGKFLSRETKEKIGKSHRGRRRPPFNEEWRKKLSEAHKREKAYNWKGKITLENRRVRGNIEFRLWREAVFARDNWTCQRCEMRGGTYLHPHHIQNFSQYPELRFAIDNGITFCKNCHKGFHKRFGFRNNTKEQLKEFLE